MSIRHSNIDLPPEKHVCKHDGYEYYRRDFVPRGDAAQCMVSIYEIPPMKSAWPYHYHVKNEETFYIVRGEGILKTPEGRAAGHCRRSAVFPCRSFRRAQADQHLLH